MRLRLVSDCSRLGRRRALNNARVSDDVLVSVREEAVGVRDEDGQSFKYEKHWSSRRQRPERRKRSGVSSLRLCSCPVGLRFENPLYNMSKPEGS